MKATKQLRNLLGISQEEMAKYLSIKRVQLAMYENGRRDLPLDALVKLADMEVFCQDTAEREKCLHPLVDEQTNRAQQLLEQYAKEQEYKRIVAERKLKATEATYAQKLLLLKFVEHLKARTRTGTANSWLNLMEAKAITGVKNSGPAAQAPQQVQIMGLRSQCKEALSLKKSMNNPTKNPGKNN